MRAIVFLLAISALVLLEGCDHHPLDCAINFVPHDDCLPGTAGYRAQHPEPGPSAIESQQLLDSSQSQLKNDVELCNRRSASGELISHVALHSCLATARVSHFQRINFPYMDLIASAEANLAVIAEDQDNKRITDIKAEQLAAEVWVNATNITMDRNTKLLAATASEAELRAQKESAKAQRDMALGLMLQNMRSNNLPAYQMPVGQVESQPTINCMSQHVGDTAYTHCY